MFKEGKMDAKDYAADMKLFFEDLKKEGIESVKIEDLINYLNNIIGSNDDLLMEQYVFEQNKLEQHKWKQQLEYFYDIGLELARYLALSGQSTLKSLFLIHGGAAVALLAFIGHIAVVEPDKITKFAPILIIFAGGVFLSAIASGTTYLCQFFAFQSHSSEGKRGDNISIFFNVLTVVLCIFSYLVFAFGVCMAYKAFLGWA